MSTGLVDYEAILFLHSIFSLEKGTNLRFWVNWVSVVGLYQEFHGSPNFVFGLHGSPHFDVKKVRMAWLIDEIWIHEKYDCTDVFGSGWSPAQVASYETISPSIFIGLYKIASHPCIASLRQAWVLPYVKLTSGHLFYFITCTDPI